MSVFNSHWLGKFQDVVRSSPTRIDAVEELQQRAGLSDIQADILRKRLVLKVPYKGLAEIETCDCTDGLHAPVESEFEGD